jgi:hypothetical protein
MEIVGRILLSPGPQPVLFFVARPSCWLYKEAYSLLDAVFYTARKNRRKGRATNARNHTIVQALVISEAAGLCRVALGKDPGQCSPRSHQRLWKNPKASGRAPGAGIGAKWVPASSKETRGHLG